MRITVCERLIKNTLVTLYGDHTGYDVWIVDAGTGHYYKGNRYGDIGRAKVCFRRYCRQVASPLWKG